MPAASHAVLSHVAFQTDVEEEKLAMLFEKCKLLKRIVDFCKEEVREHAFWLNTTIQTDLDRFGV